MKILINLLQVFERLNVEPGRHSKAKVECDGDNWGCWADHLGTSMLDGFRLIGLVNLEMVRSDCVENGRPTMTCVAKAMQEYHRSSLNRQELLRVASKMFK